MKRKVIKQGNGTLTITLPKDWTESIGVKSGDEIDVEPKGAQLLISKEFGKEPKKISVDITGLDRSTIILLLQSLYVDGYDILNVSTKDTKTIRHIKGEEFTITQVIHDSVSRLIGMEIANSSKGYFEIEDMTKDSGEKFEVILRRIFLIITELFDLFIEGIEKRDEEIILSIKFQHINLKKFINYALRLLNKASYPEPVETKVYFSIVGFLNKAGEIIKNYAGYARTEGTLKLSRNVTDSIREIRDSFEMNYKNFYKYEMSNAKELQVRRDLFKKKIYKLHKKLSRDDIFIITALTQIYDVLLDLSELRMELEYSKVSKKA